MALSVQANRIRLRRLELGMSQEQLAEAVGTIQATISRYERGENDPTAEVLAALARSLHTSSDWLLGLTENVNSQVQTESDLTPMEREALSVLRQNPPEKQQVIVNIIKEITFISSH